MKKNLVIVALLILFLGFFVFLVLDWNFPKVSASHHEPSKYDLFYEQIAVSQNLPEFCDRISSFAYRGAGWGGSGRKAGLSRSSCFFALAINQKNSVYCDKVQPINTWFLDGSKNNPAECRKEIAKNSNVNVSSIFLDLKTTKELLNELKPDYLQDSDYKKNLSQFGDEEFATREYWDKIQKTNEFILRARGLPSQSN